MTAKGFRVYWREQSGKKKTRKVYHDGEFTKRQMARQWCRNHGRDGFVIVHPDGTEEPFTWSTFDGEAD